MKNYSEKISRIFYYALIFALAVFLFKRTSGLLMPFVIAGVISYAVCGIANKISEKIGLSKRILAVLILIVFLIFVGFLIHMLIDRLVAETGRLMEFISSGAEDTYIKRITEGLEELFFENGILESLNGATILSDIIDRLINELSTCLSAILGRILKTTPRFVASAAVTVIACFYFAADRERIMNAIDGSLFKIFGDGYIKGKRRAKKVALNYMRAYGKLFALTFLEVFVGLLLLKIPYALIMAVCIASVDILPVLGAGAILLPWSLAMFLCGDHRMSLALVVLYGVITIVRQIAEPRILGARLGIHPLMSLFCVTLGVGLFGWIGVFVGPIFASIATGALRSDSESTVNTDHLTCDK